MSHPPHGGHNGGHGHSSGHNHGGHNPNHNHGHNTSHQSGHTCHGRHYRNWCYKRGWSGWTHKRWCRRLGCWLYWCPGACWYQYIAADATYCPCDDLTDENVDD